MFVTNWISPTKIQKISEITNFFRHYFYPELRYNNRQLGVQGTDWANKRDCCVRKKIWYSNQRRGQLRKGVPYQCRGLRDASYQQPHPAAHERCQSYRLYLRRQCVPFQTVRYREVPQGKRNNIKNGEIWIHLTEQHLRMV